MKQYDVAVIGGGPGGYVAALRASKEGFKTVLIESAELGGTCLNRGCIPSKTLLKHAEVIEQIEKAKNWGIETSDIRLSLDKMMARKNQVISTLRAGIAHLLSVGKIDVLVGYGKIQADKSIVVEGRQALKETINASKIIIATGSRPVVPPIQGIDLVNYDTSDTIFTINSIPKVITIVGGGVIGVEFATIFSSLGSKVHIVELGDRIIPTEDEEASQILQKQLKKKGIEIHLNKEVQQVVQVEEGIMVHTVDAEGIEKVLQSERLLIAVGRKANVEAVEELNLEIERGTIKVNDYLETSEPNIYAIGDVIGNLQLAHVASQEGLVAVSNLKSKNTKMDYSVIPRCIYTSPQIASVGLTEKQLKEKGLAYKVKSFSHQGNGKALTMGVTDGFTKLFIDSTYGEILGAVMVGESVTEMIGQASSYMHLEGTIDELVTMVQPHPSISETFMEVANSLIGKGIHS